VTREITVPVGQAPAGTAVPGDMRQTGQVRRETIYEFAGGASAFRALADAHHQRCLEDPELNHPFSHPGNPEHIQRLADYWAEVFGGPPRYSESFGGHSAMLGIHAGQGADEDLGERFVACFILAADDAGLPDDADFRAALRSYMEWAVSEVVAYSPPGTGVQAGLRAPRWGWDGIEAS
jgi:hemoglobin